jgi:hypothetical protein
MTAADILDRWEPIKGVFGNKPMAWVRLLQIIQAGPEGIKLSVLYRGIHGQTTTTRQTVHKWQEAGLITIRQGRPKGGAQGRRPLILTATPKARRLLRLD